MKVMPSVLMLLYSVNEFDSGSRNLEVRDDDVAADYSRGMQKDSSVPVSSIDKHNEGHRDGKCRHNCACDSRELLPNCY